MTPAETLAGVGAVAWVTLLIAAVLVGFSKTAIAGVGSISVALFALVLPARESTGAVLPLLIAADVVAIAVYRRHADWPQMARLLPGLIPGLGIGWLFVLWADDRVMRTAIGLIVLAMVGLQWRQRRTDSELVAASPHPLAAPLVGVGAGFATMTANSAGPIIVLYFLLAGLPMLRMLGTMAWFFFLVNVSKVPFSVGLGLITPASLLLDLTLVPAVLSGAWLGQRLVRRMNQRQFETAALVLSALAALMLLADSAVA
ncbi:MAG: sulfite exporter TauE/SafE family protein [Nocardioides sp.]